MHILHLYVCIYTSMFLSSITSTHARTHAYTDIDKWVYTYTNIMILLDKFFLLFISTTNGQVNRKRHIGNDITCLVFLEGPDCHFNPLWIRSHFLHSFVVVQLLSETTAEGLPLYRVCIYYYALWRI